MKIVPCQHCGTLFERHHNARKYCDKCQPKDYSKFKRERAEKQIAEAQERAKSLSEINRLARESGMTYGQYVRSMNI